MDDFTREHFETWLNNTCYDDEKEKIREAILNLLKDDPELIESRSWPELRNLAGA